MVSRTLTLRRETSADAIDVFHAPGVHVRASLPPVASVSCPVITTVHDLIPVTFYGNTLSRRVRMFYRWNLRRALRSARVVTVSEAARNDILAYAPDVRSRLNVIPNGVEFSPNPSSEAIARLGVQKPFVLYAGSYEPRKNIETAIDAYKQLLDAGFPHTLVAIVEAQSGHARAVKEHLTALKLGDRVRLVHGLAEAEIRALYTHAEMLCFPSLAEGFGFPPLQAAACGVPVVCSDLPSTRETIGDNALYVDTRNPRLLAAGMQRVLTDASLRARLTLGARDRARSFTWDRSVEAHVQLYEEVSRARRGAPAAIEAAG
jgi:glycosyltransferase involved in cell wall biosynthesis